MNKVHYQRGFWDNYFKYYDVLLELIPYQELMLALVDGLDLSANDKVLDLGCGTGNIRHFTQNGFWVGIDNSEAALKQYDRKFPNTKLVQASISEHLPFENASFDKIVCNNVLYTLPREQWETVVNEMKRVLKPNGKVAIANLTVDFKPLAIYNDHIRKSIASRGRVKTGKQLLTLLRPTVQMFWYNAKIKKDNQTQIYAFMRHNEQHELFMNHGFQSLLSSQQVYAGCGVLDVVGKEAIVQINRIKSIQN